MSLKVKNNSNTTESSLMIGSEFSVDKSLVLKHSNSTNPSANINLYGNDNGITIKQSGKVEIPELTSTNISTEQISANTITSTAITVSNNLNVNTDLHVSSTAYSNVSEIGDKAGTSDQNALHLYGSLCVYDQTGGDRYKVYLSKGKLVAAYVKNGTWGLTTTLASPSQTITHLTEIIEPYTIGTFCETTGELANDLSSITPTDCICKVKQSSGLNKNILGIICGDKTFATHGDVLVKVDSSETAYEVGDILKPGPNQLCIKATEEDIMFMVLHAIPRVKITSVIDKDTVAGFMI